MENYNHKLRAGIEDPLFPEPVLADNKYLKVSILPTGTVIDFYLPQVIEELKDYIDFFRAVRDAKADDIVNVHINCYGGQVDVAFNIIDVLKETAAQVKIFVEGVCASAATMIMLAGQDIEVSEHARIMIHAWSGGFWGKWNEQIASFKFDETWMQQKFRDIYKGFLTREEIESVLAGQDIYFDADETVERLTKAKQKEIEKQRIVNEIAAKYQAAINKELTIALADFDKKVAKEEKIENSKTSRTSRDSKK